MAAGRPVTRMSGSSHLNPQAGKREEKVQIGFETSQHRGGSGLSIQIPKTMMDLSLKQPP